MPSNVQFPFGSEESQFWVPHAFMSEEINSDIAPRNRTWMTIGRLRDGVKLPALQSMLDAVAARRQQSVSEPNQRWTIQAKPARESFSSEPVQKTVWCLLAMMGGLLLIACANVGNLLLSRALSRRGEFGVRLAIGAGRLRIARQLLVGAALMIQSAVKLLRVDPGLDPKGLYHALYVPALLEPASGEARARGNIFPGVGWLEPARGEAMPEFVRRRLQWHELMVERLRSVPGVELAAINGSLQAGYVSEDYQVEGWHDLVRLSPSRIGIRSGDNFRTTRLPLIAGRLLTEQDCSPGQQAVVVNQALARRCWPGQSPLGKRLSRGANEDKEEYVVVGVVKDMLDWQKDLPQQPTLYIPVERFTKSVDIGGSFIIRS